MNVLQVTYQQLQDPTFTRKDRGVIWLGFFVSGEGHSFCCTAHSAKDDAEDQYHILDNVLLLLRLKGNHDNSYDLHNGFWIQ